MSDSLAEHFKKSLEVLDEAYDYVSQQPYGETSTERNQRHGFLDVLDKHTAATKEVLAKHLAAKEPSAGVEEVASNILLCHQCKCTWNWTVTKSSRCPACRFIEPYPNDGLGE